MKLKNLCRIVLSTAPSKKEAMRLASELVRRNLAACVNVVPGVQSVYRWEGRIETAAEWLLVVKTTARASPAVCQAIAELHSYACPECITLAIAGGNESYLAWLSGSVKFPAKKKSGKA